MDIYRKMDTVYTTGCWNVHKIIIIINSEITIYYFQQN